MFAHALSPARIHGGVSPSAARDAEALEAENAALREEVLKLKAQVLALQATVSGDAFAGQSTVPPTAFRLDGAAHDSESPVDDGDASEASSSRRRQSGLLTSPGLGPAASLHRMGTRQTILDDGTEVDVAPEELATMRIVFDMIDTDHDGIITKSELVALHAKLGEAVDEEELNTALKAVEAEAMDGSGEVHVDFVSFMRLWQGSFAVFYGDSAEETEAEKRRARYQARFKFLKARIASPEVARIFVQSLGTHPSLDYRVQFWYSMPSGEDKQISPWHDIPLRNSDGSFNFVCEIPKWTRAKFEICTSEPYNPIRQDTQNGVLREYKWGDMPFNYGAFPQTWEDPDHVTPDTGCVGDNDPLDVVEIGQRQWATGAVVRVKILGVVAMIDSGETDWKVISISVEDPMAELLNDIEDVRTHMPGAVEAFVEWLRLYKSHSGVVNRFAFDGKPKGRDYTLKLIDETHAFWRHLIATKGAAALLD